MGLGKLCRVHGNSRSRHANTYGVIYILLFIILDDYGCNVRVVSVGIQLIITSEEYIKRIKENSQKGEIGI